MFVMIKNDDDLKKGLTFFFRINGVSMFAKGSNWVPAHVLPEVGSSESYVENLLQSSVEAGFNMLRVWGGGIYESDRFYETCDELGIMVWQDFIFACSMYPVDSEFIATVTAEVEHQVRRLQYHPSIALWAGNNENNAALADNWYFFFFLKMYGTDANYSHYTQEYIQLYVDTMRPIVLAEDVTRSYAISSPSNGLKTEQDGYVSDNPSDRRYGDNGWNADLYPRSRFASEFGFQSLFSWRSLMQVTAPGDLALGIDSEFMIKRQHRLDGNIYLQNQVQMRLLPPGQYDFGTEQALAKLVPLTQIYQAMSIKTEAEMHRRWRNTVDPVTGEGLTMGSLYWQLNDVWQAPSWSSI
ncbi:hypothetical protein B566_EDAN014944, partial [Ephemera danica]